ncbi:MAG: rubredoxin, partial [Desulfobacteraceae bacterium]|nr:rubredoxin [Desulfobacteraceae bacterium]
MKVWQCSVCKYIHRGEKPPEKCPICNVSARKFKEIDEASIPEKKPKREKPTTKPEPAIQESGLERIYSLLIKHHAHPVSVHTPNGILPVVVLLWIAALVFSYDILSKAAFINLIFVVIALPFVIFTGVLEWKKKCNSALTKVFKLKILAATIT